MSFRTGHAFKSSTSYSPLQFTFSEIKLATKNFNESLVIGRGGFGKVYRGLVRCGRDILLDVAIKRLDSDSSQGAGEFWAEVEMLSNLRHCHLAVDRSVDEEHWGLATWAQDSIKEGRLKQIVDPDLREIISPKCLKEFALLADRCLHSRPSQRPTMAEVVMALESILALQERPDSTLLMKIFCTKVPTSMSPPNPENSDPVCNLLDWDKRYKIILGVARVLVYLHNHAPIRIIHGDVDLRNILLDESFNLKLSGFRSAITINETDRIYVDNIPGTLCDRGIVAPEYYYKLEVSTKADVFNFGVLVFETVTGQSIIDLSVKGKRLIDYVARNWLEGTLSNIIDARIDVNANLMTKTVEIGLLCVQTDPMNRPTMKEIMIQVQLTRLYQSYAQDSALKLHF
ncbi:hypothetical protein E3N88_05707 [Mikania micrantha]|uniref:Protein kinase domain-containing protein n=1 Tax=Mikania micrantha TaxID=192012 RepID=A0A5N6PMH1_9ASTR|nr:hypothetical protein E3N88_05707 [Mikania micrantha]